MLLWPGVIDPMLNASLFIVHVWGGLDEQA
jgi:hypothetical protein